MYLLAFARKVLSIFLTLMPFLAVAGGSASGGPAALIKVNGKNYTAADLGVVTETYRKEGKIRATQNIPALKQLIDFIEQMPFGEAYLAQSIKSSLLGGVRVLGGYRTYYKVDSLPEEIINEIEMQYTKTANELEFGKLKDKKEIIAYPVAAYTLHNPNVGGTTTYLLPAYYDLNETRQMAYLIHEGIWHLKLTGAIKVPLALKDVIEIEALFQKYIEKTAEVGYHFDRELYEKLGRIFSRSAFVLQVAMLYDAQEGKFNGKDGRPYLYNDHISFDSLFSTKFSNFGHGHIDYTNPWGSLPNVENRAICRWSPDFNSRYSLDILDFQMEKFPDFHTYKVLSDLISENRMYGGEFEKSTKDREYRDSKDMYDNVIELTPAEMESKNNWCNFGVFGISFSRPSPGLPLQPSVYYDRYQNNDGNASECFHRAFCVRPPKP